MQRLHTFTLSIILAAFCCCLQPVVSNAQTPEQVPHQGLLWKISGHGLKQSSYLFGTFHLMGKSFLGPMTNLNKAFTSSKAMIGEMVLDQTAMAKTIGALVMDTSLKALLSREDYELAGQKVKEATSLDIAFFDRFKPIMVYFLVEASKHVDDDDDNLDESGDDPTGLSSAMDLYFQTEAKNANKKVLGLESVETQIHALFDVYPISKQVKLLVEALHDTTTGASGIDSLTNCYKTEDLDCLSTLLNDGEYKESEMKTLLGDRNEAWLKELPAMLKQNSSFIAVGAAHLTGKQGIVAGLRHLGYKVERVPLK